MPAQHKHETGSIVDVAWLDDEKYIISRKENNASYATEITQYWQAVAVLCIESAYCRYEPDNRGTIKLQI